MAESLHRIDSGPPAIADGGLEPRRVATLSARLNRYAEQPLLVMPVFLVFVVAWYMNWGGRRDFFATIRFEFVVGIVLLAICIFLVTQGRIPFTRSRSVLIAAGALGLAMLVQVPFAADPKMAHFIFFERGVVKFMMMAFFIIVMVQSPRSMLWFLLAFLFACLYVTQESVQGLISGGLYWESQGIMRLHGSVRMYAHPNSLAGLAMGVVPFVIFLFPVVKSKIIRLGFLAVFTTSIICVIFSGSRTAYVAIFAFLLFWWAVSPNKIRFLVSAVVLAVVLYPAVPQQYRERLKSITGKEAEGNSRLTRIQILKDAREIFLANPAGVGLASFPAVRMQRFGRFQDTHNLYFEIATNLGVQGLAAFIVFITYMFRGNRRAFREYSALLKRFSPYLRHSGLSPPVRGATRKYCSDLQFLCAVVKAVAGFVFVRLMLGFFGMDMYEIYWWFALGLTVALLNLMDAVKSKGLILDRLIADGLAKSRED